MTIIRGIITDVGGSSDPDSTSGTIVIRAHHPRLNATGTAMVGTDPTTLQVTSGEVNPELVDIDPGLVSIVVNVGGWYQVFSYATIPPVEGEIDLWEILKHLVGA
ncbi:hypothetical protein C8E05_1566 [Rhodococcus wratislaviensis]|uniref:Uncharacterized protein n=1 Tax=Rhodococcus wratislaviensis TaxID=44752 RepID=A0AB38FGY6_RHOWR|nr:hypothetical protein [Rhodococcus wratislaviensis]REE72178.1 hypothetical protein C8E05_1566 [Rhodococcus wratislaviensis]SPZ40806.1 Uncharacterised protein [Rhodococcus wratislaviensis]